MYVCMYTLTSHLLCCANEVIAIYTKFNEIHLYMYVYM